LETFVVTVFEPDSFVLASAEGATKTIDAKDKASANIFFITVLLKMKK
jgi:hypothetical protein